MKKLYTILVLTPITILSFAQPSQQWLNRFNGQGDLSDKFNSVKTDASNNIYLTGYTFSTGNAEDVVTIKLNPSGDTSWVRTYNGTGNNTDEAFDVTSDAFGNVYVTGVAKNISSGKDFVTIKYNAAGDTLWVRNYNGTGNGDDDASSIYVDGNGNVYVSGKSDGDVTALVNYDYAAIKYNAAGVQLWAVRFNGSGNGSDIPSGMAVDTSGNVYVTGRSANAVDDDYATIKYNSSGIQQWAMIYNGGYGTDRASALAIDDSSNVFVTGRSAGALNDDYATIKYSSIGVQQWIKFYDRGFGNDRATALAVDGSGNAYVTGKSSDGLSDDFATLKYDSFGTQLWAAMWAGTGNGNDAANAVKVDGAGNVYVTGQTDGDASALINNNFSTVKYSASGAQLWNQTYNGTAGLSDVSASLAVDALGNVIAAGNSQGTGTQKDGAAIKYNASGIAQWTYRFNGAGDKSDKGNAITVDGSGNTYVTGSTFRTGSSKDYCTIKYNAAGDTVWVRTYNGIANGNDEAAAIAVDISGNVYVTGYSKGTLKDYLTIKYNSIGDTLWTKRYNGTGSGDDLPVDLKLDASGNVYVTGYTDGDASAAINENYTTIKYSSTGTQLFASSYNGSGNAADIPAGLALDGTGNVYITGKSNNGSDDDYATIKYNSSGVQQWIKLYDAGQGDDRAAAITVDASANVYVTGRIANGSDDDYGTIKYSSAGVQQWLKLYDGLSGNDRAAALTADASGNVYVTGKSSNGLTDDFLTVKYGAAGTQLWTAKYNGTANGNDSPAKIMVDGAGNVVVAGQSDNGSALLSNNDYTFVKYTAAGMKLWAVSYNGTGNGTDGIAALAIDSGDNIYVTGTSFSAADQKDIVTIKYSSPVGINELSKNKFKTVIYPNPFSSQSTLSIVDADTIESWSLDVYDAAGRKVVSQKIDHSNQAVIKKDQLPNGIYFFQAINNTEIIGSGNFIIGD